MSLWGYVSAGKIIRIELGFWPDYFVIPVHIIAKNMPLFSYLLMIMTVTVTGI